MSETTPSFKHSTGVSTILKEENALFYISASNHLIRECLETGKKEAVGEITKPTSREDEIKLRDALHEIARRR